MSRHDGVSCDCCLKGNFRGRRYKCLICYDYDLCANCYDIGTTTTRHTSDHAMQCILTRNDFDLYYGGEALTIDQPQSFTCPFCGKKGFLENTLQDHISADHSDAITEVVCPICAALPGGDPNHVTDDFAAHLNLDHRPPPRDFDEPAGVRHAGRIPHGTRGRGARTRRGNIHFPAGVASTGAREAMDPIAELLSQLSSVRSRAVAAQSVSSQLQQLEMQLQSTRQQLERLPRRQMETYASVASKTTTSAATNVTNTVTQAEDKASQGRGSSTPSSFNFLLSRCTDSPPPDETPPKDESSPDVERSLFVQELLATTMAELLPSVREKHPDMATQTVGDVDKVEKQTERNGDEVVDVVDVVTDDALHAVAIPAPITDKQSLIVADTRSSASRPAAVAPVGESQPSQLHNPAVVTRRPARAPLHQFTAPWSGAAYPVESRHAHASPATLRDQRAGAAAKQRMLRHVDGAKMDAPAPH